MKNVRLGIIKGLLSVVLFLGLLICVKTTAFADDPALRIAGTDLGIGNTNANGNGWSYDASTKTITLNGFNYNGKDSAIYALNLRNLNLVLVGNNSINVNVDDSSGIYVLLSTVPNGTFNISGSGKLSVKVTGRGIVRGIHCEGGRDEHDENVPITMNIKGCTIESIAAGETSIGISLCGDLSIINADVNATGDYTGLQVGGPDFGSILVDNSNLFASNKDSDDIGRGIDVDHSIEIKNKSSVRAYGNGLDGYGIWNAFGPVIISDDVSLVEISGNTMACGPVKNGISGTGWKDVDGETEAYDIPISKSKKRIDEYKRIVFTKRKSIKEANITLNESVFAYDGSEKKPSVTSVVLDGKTLKKKVDYTVRYSNNTNIGIGVVTVTGKGNYCDSASCTFKIIKGSGHTLDEGETFVSKSFNFTVTDEEDHEVEVISLNKKTKNVAIPGTVKVAGVSYKVTSIGLKAFYKDTTIQSLIIPNTVETIENYAFYGCTQLKTVKVGKKVEEIGTSAFRKCNKLETLTLPKSMNEIGKNAFKDCKRLKKLTINANEVVDIEQNAITGTSKKLVINVPNNLIKKYKKEFTKKTGFLKTMKIV